jgi:ectoine hydroxylase
VEGSRPAAGQTCVDRVQFNSADFQRDGYQIFPALFSKAEIAVLRAETARLSHVQNETVIRERTGAVRSIFRVHGDDGATRSAAFRALVRTPRVLEPTMQALGTREVYVYHTKISPDMATFAVMLTDSVEMNGARYVIPGSHKRGRIEPYYDESTSYKCAERPDDFCFEKIAHTGSRRRASRNGSTLPLQPPARLRS